MQRRSFGATGMSVSEYTLGSRAFHPERGDVDEYVRIVHAALDAGINCVDSSDRYGGGCAEEVLGGALRGRRDDVIISTKFGLPADDDPYSGGASRRWIVR